MSGHASHLDGSIFIPAAAPADWVANGLDVFYAAPNHLDWGQVHCRVLCHESLHFWQVLASGYLAGLVAGGWDRLVRYEKTGRVPSPDPATATYGHRAHSFPFSAGDLVECWARFWDVHTRGPDLVIVEQGIPVPPGVKLREYVPELRDTAYPSAVYDLAITGGKDSKGYMALYRRMLELANGNSRFVGYTFPILAYHALNMADPPAFFAAAFRAALESDEVYRAVMTAGANLNFAWPAVRPVVERVAIAQARKVAGTHQLPWGFDVFASGRMADHPIYSWYKDKLADMIGYASDFNNRDRSRAAAPIVFRDREAIMSAALALEDAAYVFMFPGQPACRYLLGRFLQPASVHFENLTCYARRPGDLGRTFEDVATNLRSRVLAFEAAGG